MEKNKIAFIGRSNVGKSSLINYLLGQNLAKTSKHPGKTRDQNSFSFNSKFDLVDMPGYGYAAVHGKKREIWDEKMLNLFFEDPFFNGLFVLIDSSISPLKIDKDFLHWLVENGVLFSVIFTKTDKAKASELSKNLKNWREFINLLTNQHGAATTFQVSSMAKKGGAEIKKFIEEIEVK